MKKKTLLDGQQEFEMLSSEARVFSMAFYQAVNFIAEILIKGEIPKALLSTCKGADEDIIERALIDRFMETAKIDVEYLERLYKNKLKLH